MSNHSTMKDIADRLGISINAVSLALHDKQGVSNDLRLKILEAAMDMKYPLKKLNGKDPLKSKTLVVLIQTERKNDTHYYLDLRNKLEKEGLIFRYRILTAFYDFHSFVTPLCIKEHRVAGVIILGKFNRLIIDTLQSYIYEILCVNHYINHMNINSIITNDFLGGYLACQHFIKKGIFDIGFVGDIKQSDNFALRYQGYLKCLEENTTQVSLVCLLQNIEQSIESRDIKAIQAILRIYPTMPKAFVCANDTNAFVLIKALQANGYKIPQDIKVIGFDNTPLCLQSKPSLSSLKIDSDHLARNAIRRIHAMIQEDSNPEVLLFSPSIIERNSTK